MNSKLMILPFMALFSAALATVVGSSFPEYPVASYVFWGLGFLSLVAWLVIDIENLKRSFATKGAKHGMNSGMTVVLGGLVIVGIAFLASRPRFNMQWDVTRDGLNTLSDQSVKIISSLDKDQVYNIVTFFESDEKKQKFISQLSLYEAKGLRANIEHIDPKADPMRAASEKVTTVDTVILKLGSNNTRITEFSEEKISNALLKVLKSNSKKVYFTTGHGEKSLQAQEAEGFKLIADELVAERYEVSTVNLLENGKVPEDADALVLAGPKYDFHQEEIAMVDAYLLNAKPVLFLVDAMTDLPKLSSLIESYGMKLKNNILILRPDDPRSQLLGQNNSIVTDFDEFSPVTKDFANSGGVTLIVPNARSIETTESNKGVKSQLIAKTSEIVIAINNVKSAEDLQDIGPDRILGGPFAVAALATGQVGGDDLAKADSGEVLNDVAAEPTKLAKELRLGVVGSSEFVSNLGVQRGENVDMFLNMMNYLLQDESFISIRPKDITKSTLDVASPGSQFSLLFFSYLYPFMFLVGGVVYWMRRRRA